MKPDNHKFSLDGENMITISNVEEISAIYFALLQSGYDFYALGRDEVHNDRIKRFSGENNIPRFFSGVKQNTCEVYPYWPRGAILETAVFYLLPDHSCFRDFGSFRKQILAAGNISDFEKDQKLWDWIQEFPLALSNVLASEAFCNYMEWEKQWIKELTGQHEKDLRVIHTCLDVCVSRYSSPVQDIQVNINPIKCIYSADYHLCGSQFIFSSGAFRADSVIHEFLHHVVHPAIGQIADFVSEKKRIYPDIDKSYYLSGDEWGYQNAFEEYAVRMLTRDAIEGKFPHSLDAYLKALL